MNPSNWEKIGSVALLEFGVGNGPDERCVAEEVIGHFGCEKSGIGMGVAEWQ
jgi:hypothetical protein